MFDIEPNNTYALTGIGYLYFDNKKYDLALTYWIKMLQIEPDNVKILTTIGNCHRKKKTFTEGIQYFEKALEFSENNFYTLYGLADCYRGLEMHEKSLKIWEDLLAISPDNKVLLTRFGDALRNVGKLDEAVLYYQKALDIDYDYYAAIGLALISKEKKEYSEAIETLNRLYKVERNNTRLVAELAECYSLSNDKNRALSLLKSTFAEGNTHPNLKDLYNEISNQTE